MGVVRRNLRRFELATRRIAPLIFRTLALLLLIITVGFVIVDYRLKPTLIKIAETRANMIATNLVNRAIHEKVARTMRYEDLYTIRQDNRGKIVMMQPNTGEINRLAAEATISIGESLKNISEERIRIPLGQALGSTLLASMGPWISVRIVPVGTIAVNVTDRFEQAGINQTRHKLYLDVNVGIRVVVPTVSQNVNVNVKLPLTEGIILGEVPQVYLGLSELFGQSEVIEEEQYSVGPQRVP